MISSKTQVLICWALCLHSMLKSLCAVKTCCKSFSITYMGISLTKKNTFRSFILVANTNITLFQITYINIYMDNTNFKFTIFNQNIYCLARSRCWPHRWLGFKPDSKFVGFFHSIHLPGSVLSSCKVPRDFNLH